MFKNLFFLALIILTGLHSFGSQTYVTVKTNSGPVIGKVKDSLHIFKGIPYAAPPIGKLRWHAPVPPVPWASPRSALSDGPVCLQPKSLGSVESVGSEDCLNINIWSPVHTQGLLPVMVFIHGGFYVKSSSDPSFLDLVHLQDGSSLASGGHVLVVSFDYRLGQMGFFLSSVFDDHSPESRSGNFGLMDQISALKWIQKNIAAFGGDPAQVTVFGQSAGGSSILTLMASPKTEGLFARAIVQSGYLKDIAPARADFLSSRLITRTGCDVPPPGVTVATCLRNLHAEKIMASFPSSALESKEELFVPNRDGWIIPDESLEDAYAQGHVRPIPVILGTNSDEAADLAKSLYGATMKSEDDFEKIVTHSYGSLIWDRAQPIYASTSLGTVQDQLVQFSTDGIFTCPTSAMARVLSQGSVEEHVWRYVFSHHLPIPFLSRLGAFHGIELPYVFGSILIPLSAENSEKKLSLMVQNYWTNFAKTGNPNSSNNPLRPSPFWPSFDPINQAALNFTNGTAEATPINHYRESRCQALGL